MKNFTTVLAVGLMALLAALLWRLDRHLAPMAEFARAQLVDRAEARHAEQTRLAAEAKTQEAARAQAQAESARLAAAATAAATQAQAEAARLARLAEPVKPGEVVEEIYLDNHETVRGAVVVAVQASSVSFKAGSRLYNIPTEDLPEELQARVHHMFPLAAPAATPAPQP